MTNYNLDRIIASGYRIKSKIATDFRRWATERLKEYIAINRERKCNMGQKDISEKTFISLNDVFADIFNVLVFKGADVIEEDSLTDAVVRSQYKAEDGKLHEEERDAAKLWKHHNFNLVLYFGKAFSLSASFC